MTNDELLTRNLNREQIRLWCERHSLYFAAEEVEVMARMPSKLLKRHLKKLSVELDKKRLAERHPRGGHDYGGLY